MKIKAGARARLVDVPKPSPNHYSEIRVSRTQSVLPSDDWYSSVNIESQPTEQSKPDSSYDKINLSTSLKRTNTANQMRPAYDHVMAEDVLNSPPKRDGYSHMKRPKTDILKTKDFKIVEDKHVLEDKHSNCPSSVCEREDHEYYVLDPDGNLYIVHECDGTK